MEAEQTPAQYSALELLLWAGPVGAVCVLLLIGIVGVVLLRCFVWGTARRPFDLKDVFLVCFYLITTALCFLDLGIEGMGVFTAKGLHEGDWNAFALDQARLFLKIHVLAFLSILAAFGVRSIRSKEAGERKGSLWQNYES